MLRPLWKGMGFRQQTVICPASGHPLSSVGRSPPAVAPGPRLSGRSGRARHRRWRLPPPPPPEPPQQWRWWWSQTGCRHELWIRRWSSGVIGFCGYVWVLLLTWPLDLIRVSQVFWGREKHLSVGDRRPERNHVGSAVVPNGSVLLWVN